MNVNVSERGTLPVAMISRPSRKCHGVPGSLSSPCRPPTSKSVSTKPKIASAGPGRNRPKRVSLEIIPISPMLEFRRVFPLRSLGHVRKLKAIFLSARKFSAAEGFPRRPISWRSRRSFGILESSAHPD